MACHLRFHWHLVNSALFGCGLDDKQLCSSELAPEHPHLLHVPLWGHRFLISDLYAHGCPPVHLLFQFAVNLAKDILFLELNRIHSFANPWTVKLHCAVLLWILFFGTKFLPLSRHNPDPAKSVLSSWTTNEILSQLQRIHGDLLLNILFRTLRRERFGLDEYENACSLLHVHPLNLHPLFGLFCGLHLANQLEKGHVHGRESLICKETLFLRIVLSVDLVALLWLQLLLPALRYDLVQQCDREWACTTRSALLVNAKVVGRVQFCGNANWRIHVYRQTHRRYLPATSQSAPLHLLRGGRRREKPLENWRHFAFILEFKSKSWTSSHHFDYSV